MTPFKTVLSILSGMSGNSSIYLDPMGQIDGLDCYVDIDAVDLRMAEAHVRLSPEDGGETIKVQTQNTVRNAFRPAFRDPNSALHFALYCLDIKLDPEDSDALGLNPDGSKQFPKPACTFADHSAPAYTKEQLKEYAQDMLRFVTGNSFIIMPTTILTKAEADAEKSQFVSTRKMIDTGTEEELIKMIHAVPIVVDPSTFPYADEDDLREMLYKHYGLAYCEDCGAENAVDCECEDEHCEKCGSDCEECNCEEEEEEEWCEQCGGQIGDDCDCNHDGCDEDEEESEEERCEHCGCQIGDDCECEDE